MDSPTPKPRRRQFNRTLPDRIWRLLGLLTAHYEIDDTSLIIRLIEQAADVARKEIAARPSIPIRLPSDLEIDSDEIDDERFRREKAAIDHIEP